MVPGLLSTWFPVPEDFGGGGCFKVIYLTIPVRVLQFIPFAPICNPNTGAQGMDYTAWSGVGYVPQ